MQVVTIVKVILKMMACKIFQCSNQFLVIFIIFDYISALKSKGLSVESTKSPAASNNSIAPTLNHFHYVGFQSGTFTFHRASGKGGRYLFNSSLPRPRASQALRYQPGNYWTKLTCIHNLKPDSNQKPMVSESKSLTTNTNYE